LILEEWLSLDGYAVDSEGTLDFSLRARWTGSPTGTSSRSSRASTRSCWDDGPTSCSWTTGRRATTDTEIIADRLNELPKLVFSNTLSEAPWGTWPPARVVRGDAVSEIERLRSRTGSTWSCWGSLSLAQELIAADLIDEYQFQLCPTLVGGGRSLFPACTATRGSSA
jgi:dihydrofolate reductase